MKLYIGSRTDRQTDGRDCNISIALCRARRRYDDERAIKIHATCATEICTTSPVELQKIFGVINMLMTRGMLLF